MLGRGLTHYLGSELSSKVISWSKRFEKEEGRAPNDAETEAYRADALAAMIAALNEGTVGTAVRGPAVDPVEVEMEKIARAEIHAIIKSNKLKWIGKGDERHVVFADGQTRTMDEMLEKRTTQDTVFADGTVRTVDQLRKAAEKNIKARAKALDAVKGQIESL
jgi:hypothetical protein